MNLRITFVSSSSHLTPAPAVVCHGRLFGTFEAEKPDVKIVYGLVDQPQFWNPLKHQVTALPWPRPG